MENGIDIVGIDETQIGQINTPIDEIGGENVNLIYIAIDSSGSMSSYVSDMEKCLQDFKTALSGCKETDDILVSRANFNSSIQITGYKKISELDVTYGANGNTALYDVIVEGKEKLMDYVKYLKNQGVWVKPVFAVFSDGEDTASHGSQSDARKAVDELNAMEVITAFITFGSGASGIAKQMNFKNVMSVGGSVSELRKAFDVLTKSVILSSRIIGAGNQSNFFVV